MTRHPTPGTVAVLLPDDWAVLDLEDDAARTACVEGLVAPADLLSL